MTFLGGMSGCQSLGLNKSSFGFRNRESEEELASTDDIKGPLERILPIGARGSASGPSGAYAFSERNPEYQKASKLYDDGKYAEAEKAFKQLAKSNKETALAGRQHVHAGRESVSAETISPGAGQLR
ncbi:MAG: hypothetical protein R3C11_02670 [Planctomycetaceae bacterium]